MFACALSAQSHSRRKKPLSVLVGYFIVSPLFLHSLDMARRASRDLLGALTVQDRKKALLVPGQQGSDAVKPRRPDGMSCLS